MDFSVIDLDPAILSFWRDARSFFDGHVTPEVHALERSEGSGFNEALHLAMGKRGWVVPQWSVLDGGADLDPVRNHLLAWEYRRSGAPAILHSTTLLPLSTIKSHGSPDFAAPILDGVADGTVRICLGYTEPDAGSDLAAVRTRASAVGDHWVIDGQKMFTTGAQWAQYCFLLVRTDPDAPKHRGLTVFLVPLDLDGIEIAPVETLGGERTNFVYYDGVEVDDRYRLGEPGAGWSVVQGALDAEHGLGVSQHRLGDAAEGYEHYTANVLHAVERAVGKGDVSLGADLEEALGRAALHVEQAGLTDPPYSRLLSSEDLIADAEALVELLGPRAVLGAGSTDAIADGLLEQTHRFAQGTAIYGGTTEIFRNLIAERILGLPRAPRPS